MNLFFKKLKKIIPLEMYILLNKIRYLIIYRKYRNLNNEMLFTKIYKNKMWNNKSKLIFDSGSGSHEEFIVKKYVQTINNFLAKKKVSVVDLGCGDFNIASKFYKNCKKYYGIDVVPELISHLKKKFNDRNAKFMCVDATKSKLPNADCVLIKEVLQHLTNTEISDLLINLRGFKYVIITESYPFKLRKINLDKIKGPLSRSYNYSAVEIDKEPFNFSFKKKSNLLSIKREGIGYLKTILYEN